MILLTAVYYEIIKTLSMKGHQFFILQTLIYEKVYKKSIYLYNERINSSMFQTYLILLTNLAGILT